MKSAPDESRVSRTERIARAVIGMPARHPELITPAPARAEWRHLADWCAELWPNDEYTLIVAECCRQRPPKF
jgi:hypothetical protein